MAGSLGTPRRIGGGLRPVRALTLLVLVLSGCTGIESALEPSAQHAAEVLWLWWLMVGVLVAAFARDGRAARRPVLGSRLPEVASANRTILAGGLLLPGVTILVFLIASLRVSWLTATRGSSSRIYPIS